MTEESSTKAINGNEEEEVEVAVLRLITAHRSELYLMRSASEVALGGPLLFQLTRCSTLQPPYSVCY